MNTSSSLRPQSPTYRDWRANTPLLHSKIQYMPPSLTKTEAQLLQHFVQNLGRWLDCTNAARMFTLSVAANAGTSPVLLNAVVCFSGRHQGAYEESERAYEDCIKMLIVKLGAKEEAYDECLLGAVLLLHFADQLECKGPLSLILSCSFWFVC